MKHLGRYALAALMLLIARPSLAQAPYKVPRDVNGHPSLEGVWSARWLTSLERPAGTPLVLNGAEVAAELKRLAELRARVEMFDAEFIEPDATSLAVVRGQHRASLIVEPPDGRLPLSDAGKAALAALPKLGADGPEHRAVGERCISGPNHPGMLIIPAVMLKQFVQTPTHVLMVSESFNEVRILAPGAGMQDVGTGSYDGQSRSWWAGDSLVVESTGFRRDDLQRAAPFQRFPIRPETKITERFTRTAADEIVYDFVVDDPVLFTRPFRVEYAFTRTSDRIYEFACHEGNYGLANILSGARYEEQQARVGSAKP